MNVIENIAHTAGRAVGQYRRGIESIVSVSGSRPSVNDESAWLHPTAWGPALLQGRKPRTKQEFIDNFTSWVYICVRKNAQAIASVPLKLYVAKPEKGQQLRTVKTKPITRERMKYLSKQNYLDHYLTKAEEVEEITEHPFLDLMKNVNPFHNDRDLKEFTTMFLDLCGECYWLLVKSNVRVGRESIRKPMQIYPIPAQFVEPIPGKTLDKAIIGYKYQRGNVEVDLKYDDVIMFHYPNPQNIFQGFSTIRGVADAVYVRNQMNAFETHILENRAQYGNVFETTELISRQDRERMKEDFAQKHRGAIKAGKDIWLPRGVKIQRGAMTPMEINFIEGRQLNLAELALAFDIPPGILMSGEVKYTNMDVSEYMWAKSGIKPRCDRYAEKVNERLLPMYDEKLFCAFDDPIPENREMKLKERTEHVKAGITTRDEEREEIGKDAMGDLAAELLTQGEVTPITGETAQTEPPEPPTIVAPPPGEGNEGGEEEEEEVAERILQRIRKRLRG